MRARLAGLAALLGLLAALPHLPGVTVPWLTVLTTASYYAVFAMSWDILSGYTGQISFGHAFFIAAASYTSGLLNLYLKWPLEATIPLGVLAAIATGLLVGVPALRLRGPYFALVTLILPLVAWKFVTILRAWTGGELGKFGLAPLPGVPLRPYELNRLLNYYYALGLMGVVTLGLLAVTASRLGRVFEAIREDEEVVEAAGLHVAKYKVLAFALSGLVAGLGGAFYVHFWRAILPGTLLTLQLSVELIIAAVAGGMGTILGPVLGAYFLVAGQYMLKTLADRHPALGFLAGWSTLAFLVLLLLLVFFARGGLLTGLRALWARWEHRPRPLTPAPKAE